MLCGDAMMRQCTSGACQGASKPSVAHFFPCRVHTACRKRADLLIMLRHTSVHVMYREPPENVWSFFNRCRRRTCGYLPGLTPFCGPVKLVLTLVPSNTKATVGGGGVTFGACFGSGRVPR